MFDAWHDRNVRRFGEPKTSGDDCHETAAVQEEYLRAAGFRDVPRRVEQEAVGNSLRPALAAAAGF